jgi:hypothetical protein
MKRQNTIDEDAAEQRRYVKNARIRIKGKSWLAFTLIRFYISQIFLTKRLAGKFEQIFSTYVNG